MSRMEEGGKEVSKEGKGPEAQRRVGFLPNGKNIKFEPLGRSPARSQLVSQSGGRSSFQSSPLLPYRPSIEATEDRRREGGREGGRTPRRHRVST